MLEAQNLDFLTEQFYVQSPVQSVHQQFAKLATAPSSALTINTGLAGLIGSPQIAAQAPTLKAVSALPSSRRFLGQGLTRMHPYYYVQYVPLDLKQNLVGGALLPSLLVVMVTW